MSLVEIDYLGEGAVDEAIARKLILAVAGTPGKSYRRPISGTGKQSLDKRLSGLNAGVQFGKPVLILRDLDHDAPCAGALVASLLKLRHEFLLLRICVRESEAWLFADHRNYGRYCGIKPTIIPELPELIVDPKQLLNNWAADGRAPKLKRFLDDAMTRAVPLWASLGEWNAKFVEQCWNPWQAADSGRVPSLTKAILRLQMLIEKLSRDQ